MKLTKGKISKLYNKKKQTVRKRKEGGYKNKNTFRNKKHLNLANKTLKLYDFHHLNKEGGGKKILSIKNRGLGFLGYPGRLGIWPEITVIELAKG